MDGTILNKKYDLVSRVEALEEGGGGGSEINFGSFTGTTSPYGVLTPSPSISVDSKFVVGVYGNGSYVVIPFVASSDNTWRFMVLQSNNMQPLAEQEATVNFALITREV